MTQDDTLNERQLAKLRQLVEKAIDKAVLLDTERSSQITDVLIMLLTEAEQILEGNEPWDGEEPEQLELDFGNTDDDDNELVN